MSRGKINLQAADGAVIGLVVPDGLASGERQIALGSNLSNFASYHLIDGNLSVDSFVSTQGFNTTLYTGNGTAQSINTGIDMATQWGNDASETFGGLVWGKSRSSAISNCLYDTVRGVLNRIETNTTAAQVSGNGISSFTTNGFTLGNTADLNTNLATYASWNFQTTHRVSGTTNHGKAYTCHYNPFTGFTMVKYEGSGIAGHEIPHHLGRKLGFANFKNLTTVQDWLTYYGVDSMYMAQNLTIAGTAANVWSNQTDTAFKFDGGGTQFNQASSQHVMYGWANSYFDESNKLIGNYELVSYQGTGVAGNKVKTKGKPAWVMVKRTDSTGNWYIVDNQRGLTSGNSNFLIANAAAIEASNSTLIEIFNPDGFTHNGTSIEINTAGGQYIALVAYDTNSNGGGSYYPRASDASNVQINNALIPLAQGIDGNGAKNTILSKNETITGLTYTQGKNYVYCDKNGSYGVTPYKPRYLESELVRTFASEAPEYYDVAKNKWFSTSGNGELIPNGTFDSGTTVWTAVNGVTSNPSDTLQFTANLSVLAYVYTSISTTVGSTYTLKVTTNSMSDSQVWLYIGSTYNNGDAYLHSGSTPWTLGIKDVVFTAVSTTTYICFRIDNGRVVNLDNISVFATEIIPATEITNSRNYLNHIVHADNDGGVLYVEELPKVEYKDIVKANEFRGKNANKVAIAFNGNTTPVAIIGDMIGFATVIRTATGVFDIYPSKDVDIRGLKFSGMTNAPQIQLSGLTPSTTDKITVIISNSAGTDVNSDYISIIGVGE